MRRLMAYIYLGILILQGTFILLAVVVALLMDTVAHESVYGRPLLYGSVGVGAMGIVLTYVTQRRTASAKGTVCAAEDSVHTGAEQ